MPPSPLAMLMRQIETDMRSPMPPEPRFDADRYFAEGGPVDEDTYGPSNIEERKARLEERLEAERRATVQYPGDVLEAPQGFITPAKAVRWVETDAGPMAVDAEGNPLPLIRQPGVLPLYRDPTIDSVRMAMPAVADIAGNMMGAPGGIAAGRVLRAGMTGERPAANVVAAGGASEAPTKVASGRKMTLTDVRREFDPRAGEGMNPEDVDRLVDAYGRVASPASEHPEIAEAGRKIAESYITKGGSEFGGRSYFGHKPSTPLEELGRVAEPVPYTEKPKAIVEKSWEDVGRERGGSPLITLGGDLSDLVRLRGYGAKDDLRAIARPTDIHAGFDYMLEPNPNTVWANAPEHAAMLNKQVLDQKEILRAIDKDLPIMATAAPMGPRAVDSAKNMMDLYLSAVEGSAIPAEHLKKAADDIRSGAFGNSPKEKAKLKEKLADFPGFEDMDAARKFLLENPDVAGITRAAIIKGMERADWVKKGFPEVGQLRVAATSPKFMMAPGNMMGGRMVELDPRMFALAQEGKMFEHYTYPGDTAGQYYADVPMIHRQYGAPDVTDALMAKYNVWRPGATKSAPPKAPITVHPFSTDQAGRDTWRKMFEEQRMAQPINERMMESIARGEARRSQYGFASGGRAVVGHTSAAGVPVSLEEHKGEIRHRAHSGDSRMAADYGYIDTSKPDHDGMKTDAFVGPHKDSKKVFVINQQHPHTKKFNEHKVMLGYNDRAHALRDYAHSFSDGLGHKRIHSVVEMGTHELKDWLKKGHTKPLRKAEGGEVFDLKASLGRLMPHV